jgi:hypothetical protein
LDRGGATRRGYPKPAGEPSPGARCRRAWNGGVFGHRAVISCAGMLVSWPSRRTSYAGAERRRGAARRALVTRRPRRANEQDVWSVGLSRARAPGQQAHPSAKRASRLWFPVLVVAPFWSWSGGSRWRSRRTPNVESRTVSCAVKPAFEPRICVAGAGEREGRPAAPTRAMATASPPAGDDTRARRAASRAWRLPRTFRRPPGGRRAVLG